MVIIVGVVTMGGIKRIGQVAEFLAPIMCGIYLLVMVIIMIVNAERIPSVFGSIFASAFGKDAVFGGIVGSALSWGIKRGFFSNDAGNGMSPVSYTHLDVYKRQGTGYFIRRSNAVCL